MGVSQRHQHEARDQVWWEMEESMFRATILIGILHLKGTWWITKVLNTRKMICPHSIPSKISRERIFVVFTVNVKIVRKADSYIQVVKKALTN